MLEALARLFAPERCVHCDEDYGDEGSGGLCRTCERDWRLFEGEHCAKCGWPFSPSRASGSRRVHDLCRRCRASRPPYDSLRALGWYEGALAAAVKAAKFAEDRQVFGRFLPPLVARAGARPFDAVVAIPSDHSLNGELARELAHRLRAPVLDPLTRSPDAARQVGFTRRARRENARKAIRRRDEIVSGRVLLLDDIVTTGASIEAAAELLRDAGASEVRALALARARAGISASARDATPPSAAHSGPIL